MDVLRKVYQYAEPNITLIGWFGFFGFPAYYVIWEFIFPQPYENLFFRLLCSLFFLGLIYRKKLHLKWRKYIYWYYQVVIIICLPCFFFYMLLMNDWSHIWGMSFMAAIFLHILLVHIIWVMTLQAVVGLILATTFAWIAKGHSFDITVDWAQLPIFLFSYLFGSFYFSRYQEDYDSKVTLAKSFGAGIAHEIRNPFSSLSASIHIIQSVLPDIKIDKKENYQLSWKEVNDLHELSSDAIKIIDSGHETINLLLTAIDENGISQTTFKKHSAQVVINNAIASFSYKNKTDRSAVSVDVQNDFEFFGNDLLFKYVIYNLFKNAFRHRSVHDFSIHVTLRATKRVNEVIIKDTGSGISDDVIENIFKDFYTTDKLGGYGLGLPFCKKVMHAFGGDIQCNSQPDCWTEFFLTFPLSDSNYVNEIKNELIKYKSVLFVSDQKELVAEITETRHSMGFALTVLSVVAVLNNNQCSLNYDLVMVDIDSFKAGTVQFDQFESLYSASKAPLVYLYQSHPPHRYTRADFHPIWLETKSWLSASVITLNDLLFDTLFDNKVAISRPLSEELKRTIMVVDDNQSLREYTAILLEKQGYEVIRKESGKQAIEALNVENVDLILMDIDMPAMDGLETSRYIRQLKKDFSDIPIIAHTGDSSVKMINKINDSYMSGYIIKPASKEKLFNTIADWVE